MTAYYNDNDPKSAAWVRELIKAGLVADGDVDERSILDVQPEDLRGFTQCHFFAGVAGWSYSLRLAGFPDDREVWTGSPPCQPFSVAGKQDGKDDARHLAPKFASLVRAARPALLFGEQVASAAVFGPSAKGNRPGFEGTPPWAWLDDLSDRLEAARYAVWANDVPAAGVGGPHIRQRTFFGALRLEQATGDGRLEWRAGADGRGAASGRGLGGVADTIGERGRSGKPRSEDAGDARVASEAVRMADAHGDGRGTGREIRPDGEEHDAEHGGAARRGPGPVNGVWRDADWLYCRDGKWRPVEPGTFPLAHGIPGRVGLLRGYGNAIVPAAAQAFIEAALEALDDVQCLRLMSGLEADVFA